MDTRNRRVLTDAEHQQNYDRRVTAHEIRTQYENAITPFEGEFHEMELLDELRAYIRGTYGEHYAKDGVQAFALIAKRPERGLAFALGNVIKYSDRFGQKAGHNRKDLLKVAHYSILALHCADALEKAKS